MAREGKKKFNNLILTKRSPFIYIPVNLMFQIIPVMLYTNAGLLLYNLKGWLEVEENSQSFTENERLVATLDADDRLTIGPQRRSSAYREQDAFFLTRNIVLHRGQFWKMSCVQQ